jgi:hypothetical protein
MFWWKDWRENRDEVAEILGPDTLLQELQLSFGKFALKIWISANHENCVPGDNEGLLYWPILNFYSEIWRTRKKTISAFMEHLWFDHDLGF